MAEGFDINNILQNKMFLQMLSAGGADLMQGTGGANLNQAVQGNIASQNFAGLLKTLLGPDGTKATLSNQGMNLTVPKETELFKSMLGEPFKVDQSLVNPNSLSNQPAPNESGLTKSPSLLTGGNSPINPFVGSQPNTVPDIPAADLAGLSPKDIATVIGLRQNQDELHSKTLAQIQDMAYKTKLMQNIDSEISERSPRFEIPGIGKVNTTQYLAWEKLNRENKPNEVKLYEYAIRQGFDGSFLDFEDRAKTAHKKDYDEAIKGGYKGDFNTWMLQMAKAGAVNLGEFREKEKIKDEVEAENYFSSGKFQQSLDKKLEEYRNVNWKEKDPVKKSKAEAEFKVTTALDELAARGFTVQRKYWLDSQMTTAAIDVVSKSGKKETIKIRVK